MTKNQEAESNDHPSLAIGVIMAGVGLLTMGDVIAKSLTEHLTPFHYVLLRSIFAFIPVMIALQISRTWRQLRTKRPLGQAARGLCMATAYSCYLQALQELPIADATAIIFSSPFIVAALSRWVLGERVPAIRWVAISLGFLGALVIVQPGTEAFRPAALWGLAGAVAAAATGLLARRLGSTEPASVTAFYTTVAFLLTGLFPVTLIPGHWVAVTGMEVFLIAIAGLIAGTAHFLIILAYRKGEASLVAPFEYVSLFIAIAMGYVFFDDIPTPAVWVGIGLVAIAGVLLSRRGAPAPKKA
ncbi:MAG: DMT family transporter [Alphaproteobacteria bacterium]|nr:DMT family transporter [Rhodospirillaceae bacterium]MDG2481240.1 DMT family transporter [Alphaproteobacteria bacterium]MBT6206079.1 DMT family transporter [Rhodospirillaceae bacterium]MBT6508846.1 DMT family transporter [Rhodospirillaceae bacterium]MBT7615531.1 DMT family transporter [Rhodospirillaceae bacterium]